MSRLLSAVIVAVPGSALADGGPFAHAHPHGLEVVLGAFAVIAVASAAAWRLSAARRRRDDRR